MTQSILFLDDDEPLVFMVRRLLEHLGYQVAGFTRPEEALAAFQAEPTRYALVLSDISIPGASGMEFARRVLEIHPDANVVLASGCIDPGEAAQARALGVRAVIEKPATLEQFRAALKSLVTAECA